MAEKQVVCNGRQKCKHLCFHGTEAHKREDIWCTKWFFCDTAGKRVRCTKVKEKL